VTRLEVRRAALRRTLALRSAPARRAGLTWPRLPAAAEVAIIAVGYFGYALVRLAVRAGRHAAFVHAAELWRAERWLHLDAEPSLNHLAAAHPALAETAGYYYGLLHFIVTPLVLAWLYLRRPPAFPRLRSALVLAASAANIVFWTWPAAPPGSPCPG
jgi:PAP2 superfamily